VPNIRTMMGSKYLKKEDVPTPQLVAVASLTQEDVNSGEGKTEQK
jgi:hypothetical protein